MKDGEPCTSRGVSTVLEGVTPRPLTKGSMAWCFLPYELYVMQKTLQPREMERRGLMMFDAWASVFGKIESSLEIRPEGSGYQMKTRFSKFHNLPELMNMLNMVADIKTSDMLDLPIPTLKNNGIQVIKTPITPGQKEMMEELVERAEVIRQGSIDSSQDNFLKLTNEARLLAVDPRILDGSLPDDPDTKLNACAKTAAQVYRETAQNRSTQLIFCDKGIPRNDGRFDFYHALKKALAAHGVEEKEIFFIHDADTDSAKAELFEQVRRGKIRILIGSTEKMGTGINVQDKMTALHHLDAPWRPADLTQRNGRILRQGNENKEVSIFNYVTEQTFDAYMWQILEQKQRYISQIMTGRSAARSCEDVDEVVLQYAQFKALAVSDPTIKRKMEVDNEVYRLQTLKSAWKSEHTKLQEDITVQYPLQIQEVSGKLANSSEDAECIRQNRASEFEIILNHRVFDERPKAGEYLKLMQDTLSHEIGKEKEAGVYAGLKVLLRRTFYDGILLCLAGREVYTADISESALGNILRIENLAKKPVAEAADHAARLESLKQQLESAREQIDKPFAEEEKLGELLKEQVELNLQLEFAEEGENEEAQKNSQAGRLGRRVYRELTALVPTLFDGSYTFMRFTAPCMDDLVFEKTGNNEYAMFHRYFQNGDQMYDPEIVFCTEGEKCVRPLTWRQDNLGFYYDIDSRTEEQREDLFLFWKQWIENIKSQGFTLESARGEKGQYDRAAEEDQQEAI